MGAALGWGALAASSLVIGALLGLARPWRDRLVGLVLAFGAGALISAVSFDLAAEGARVGSGWSVAIGLGTGALTYFIADRLLDARTSVDRRRPTEGDDSGDAGTALALGGLLDGIPEQLVLGIGIASGDGLSIGLMAAIFVSNLPEAIGSATSLRATGHSSAYVIRLWCAIAGLCALASVGGYAVAAELSGEGQAVINGFAAGALLVMLIDSMVPEAARKGGRTAGLVAALGFAVAAGLSQFS